MPDAGATIDAGPALVLVEALAEPIRQVCDPSGRVAARVTWGSQCALVRRRRDDRARVQAWLGPFTGGEAIPAAVQPQLLASGWQAGELGGSGRSMFLELDVKDAGRLAPAIAAAMIASAGDEARHAVSRIDLVDDVVRWRPIAGFVAVLVGLLAGTIAVVVARIPPYAAVFDWTAGVAGTKAAGGAVFIAVSATLFGLVAGAAGIAGLARRALRRS